MSVNSIFGSSSASSEWYAKIQQQQQDFAKLAQSLQSGNLTAAQAAFAALQQLMPQSAQTQAATQTTQTTQTSQLQADMNTLSQALKSGDLSAAQKAFQAVQQDMKAGHKGHHHHHGTPQLGAPDPTPTLDPTTTAQSAGSLSITV